MDFRIKKGKSWVMRMLGNALKLGHLYELFLKYVEENPDDLTPERLNYVELGIDKDGYVSIYDNYLATEELHLLGKLDTAITKLEELLK